MATRNMTDDWQALCLNDFFAFQKVQDGVVSAFDKFESCLLALGLLGNGLALATFVRSRQMQTPSFVYHKALVTDYLIYCLNFLIVKCVNLTLTKTEQRQQLGYPNPVVAYYSLILTKVLTSVCGFLALYTSLAISVDRFLALALLKHYAKFNRHTVAYIWVAIALVLSIFFHSWSPWLEYEILADRDPMHRSNRTVFFLHVKEKEMNRLKPYLMAKDWYNLTVRFAYAIILIVLTSTVIYMFAKQRKKRQMLCNVTKRQLRRERSLFYLMVAVVIMSYIQLIPREVKRVLEFIYPAVYLDQMVGDPAVPPATRCSYMLLGLYIYKFSNSILNLCTIMERSLLFYFYFALNHSFRKELLILLHLKKAWRRVSVKLGLSKPESNKRSRRKVHRKDLILESEMTTETVGRGSGSLNDSQRRWPLGRFGSASSNGTIFSKRYLSPGGSNRSGVSMSSSAYSGFSETSAAI